MRLNLNGALSFEQRIKPRLLEVQRPARYLGGEQGQIVKPWNSVPLRVALAFPDIYEIGMSYHGRELLYQRLNARPDTLCERVFLPARDMEALLRAEGVPLWALESQRAVREFDVLGISFTHELAYPSGLLLLELAGLPLYSCERGEDDPLVIAGGQCLANPEPLAEFVDVAVNGEGEEVLDEIVAALLALQGRPRLERLRALAQIPGCYVPRFYRPVEQARRYAGVEPREPGLPRRIAYRYVADFAALKPPTRPLVPFLEVPSDKVYLEVLRGCPRGCRFCQAGYITRPARARPVGMLRDAAAELARWTGADEVGLMSLSTLDHPQFSELIEEVKQALPPGVGVALPSLRADVVSAQLAESMRRPRETSLTVAVEAGGDAMRRAINKHVSTEEVLATFGHLLAAGWHKFKLYFMCGFHGEELAAMDEIAALVHGILQLARAHGGRRPRLNVAVSVLVPKAHTPLQWQAMERPQVTRDKLSYLRREFKHLGPAVNLSWHDPEQSVIEALLGRGGRELAPLLLAAMRAGQTLLSDNFDYAVWERLCTEHHIDLEQQVYRERAAGEVLPWSHIDRGVGAGYLWAEWEAYRRGEPTEPCHEACTHCGLNCGGPVFG